MSEEKNLKNYSIGLDIGDTGVGWAVISDDFGVVEKSGKRLIGTRLFDIGNSAKNRRLQRIARRRLERRRQRITLLRSLMADEINALDPSFFQRLDMSFLKKGDEFGRRFTYNLFDGIGLTDKGFYKRFPTIYHLRNYLLETQEKVDIRWIYLAFHHMIKYRGNFLMEGEAENIGGFKRGDMKELFAAIDEVADTDFAELPEEIVFKAEDVLTDKSRTRKDRVKTAAEILSSAGYKDNFKNLLNALLGMKFKLGLACFSDEEITGEDDKPAELSFNSENYDEEEANYLDALGDNAIVLGRLRKLYYLLEFSQILGTNDYISQAMLETYQNHAEDKKLVKRLLKKYVYDSSDEGVKAYRDFFTAYPDEENVVCYANYIAKPAKVKEKNKPTTPEELIYKKITSLIEKYAPEVQPSENNEDTVAIATNYKEDPDYLEMVKIHERRDLLPKLNAKRNGAIPNQMHLKEMNVILEKQGKYYPCLSENADKIRNILTFVRPYYVGVLGKNSPNNWYKKEIDGVVTPWNFYEKIDTDYAEEQFISRLVGKCSVFPDEKVLPKQSFLYGEYMVLNELNKIKVGKKPIDIRTKQKLYNDLFKSPGAKASVSAKDIAEYLVNSGYKEGLKADDISGLTGENGRKMANVLKAYRAFTSALKGKFNESDIPLYEKVVYTNTVFSDTKTREKRIKNLIHGAGKENIYCETDIKNMAKLQFSGWGRFSEKVLSGTKGFYDNHEVSVIELMYESNNSFMEICWDKAFGFKEQFFRYENKKLSDVKQIYNDLILPSYTSPIVKKATYETVKLIDEIKRIMGADPHKIYIETTLGEDLKKKKKYTDTRAKQLKEAIDVILSEAKGFNKSTWEKYVSEDQLKYVRKKLDDENIDLNKERYYLWFRQLSRSLYSGKVIDWEDIATNCEVDHLIPRSLIKDDSIENKVLVLKGENQNKGNDKVLPFETIKVMSPFWKVLRKAGLIGSKKFNNLMRTEWKESDIEGFINRQLVETSQIIKEVQKILEQAYGEPSLTASEHVVTPVRAKLSDEFKKELGYFKIRELNNLHHAKDAYAAAVLGKFCDLTVKQNIGDFRNRLWDLKKALMRKKGEEYSDEREKNLHGIILDMMFFKFGSSTVTTCDRDGSVVETTRLSDNFGEIVWDTETLNRVKKNIFDNRILFTKKIEKEANGAFYDQNARAVKDKPKISLRYVNDNNGNKIPLPPEVYGGYSSQNDIYTVVVDYEITRNKKVSNEKLILGIPARIHALGRFAENDYIVEQIKSKISKNANLNSWSIADYIYLNQMFDVEGQLCFFVSTGELNNAVQIKDEIPIYNPKTGEYEKTVWQETISLLMKKLAKKEYLPKEKEGEYSVAMESFVLYYADSLIKKCTLYKEIGERLKVFVTSGKFSAVDYFEKQNVIREIMKIGSIKQYTGKLADYEIGTSNVGRLKKTISPGSEIVKRSITGFWEKKEKL